VNVTIKGTKSALGKSLPQPKIKVHLEICFNLCSVLLDLQSFNETTVFDCAFAHPLILLSSYLVKNSVDWVLATCVISYEMHKHGLFNFTRR